MADQKDPLELSIQQPRKLYDQISEHVRSLILSGALRPGEKLPSTKELALKWKVPVASVQAALTPLVKEGLLTRFRKKGTFVMDRDRRLERVGLYYDTTVWRSASFKHVVHAELVNLGTAKGIKLEAFFDSRKPRQRTTPFSEVIQAVKSRRIQALIATDIAVDEADLIEKLPIPTAVFVEAPHPAKVDLDFDQFLAVSLAKLKKGGCQSAGIISLRGPNKPPAGKVLPVGTESFGERFAAECRRHGLATREEWVETASEFVQGGEAQERFGYERFSRIWRRAVHPDGLIVYPDSSAEGVITAILEKRLEVPRDLQLVLHKHQELDYLCPLAASFVVSSAADVARALLTQINRQFRGEPREPIIVPFAE